MEPLLDRLQGKARQGLETKDDDRLTNQLTHSPKEKRSKLTESDHGPAAVTYMEEHAAGTNLHSIPIAADRAPSQLLLSLHTPAPQTVTKSST